MFSSVLRTLLNFNYRMHHRYFHCSERKRCKCPVRAKMTGSDRSSVEIISQIKEHNHETTYDRDVLVPHFKELLLQAAPSSTSNEANYRTLRLKEYEYYLMIKIAIVVGVDQQFRLTSNTNKITRFSKATGLFFRGKASASLIPINPLIT